MQPVHSRFSNVDSYVLIFILDEETMESPDEMLYQLGAFEPFEAKKVLALLEAHKIPFEVEADHSALSNPTRPLQFYFGIYPEGSKLIVFVPGSKEKDAMEVLKELFRV